MFTKVIEPRSIQKEQTENVNQLKAVLQFIHALFEEDKVYELESFLESNIKVKTILEEDCGQAINSSTIFKIEDWLLNIN